MRHAKAEPFASTDHERALTERGIRAARDAGRHLAQTGVLPDHVVVSSAVRAQATWTAAAEGLASWESVASSADPEDAEGPGSPGSPGGPEGSATVRIDEAVYSGSADVVLDALRALPADARVAAFIGHNPSAGEVVNQLDDGDGDPDAIHQMLHGFPAGALVVYEVEVPWSELGEQTGRVSDFYVGQG